MRKTLFRIVDNCLETLIIILILGCLGSLVLGCSTTPEVPAEAPKEVAPCFRSEPQCVSIEVVE